MTTPSTPWTREAVAAEILAGECLVIYHDLLLRIPKTWLEKHPGGVLSILHFVGRDATDEIAAYHPDHVLELVRRYKVGTVELPWQPLVPPVMSGWVRTSSNAWYNEADAVRSASNTQILLVPAKQHADAADAPTRETLEPGLSTLSLEDQARHSAAYKVLHKRIRDAGLYNTRYLAGYGPEVLRYTLLGGLSAYAYWHSWFIASAVFLGLMWQQLTFVAHDLGHVSVTHNWAIDRLLGILVADWIGGLSIGWWVNNHNVHHLVTNHPTHDPDIEHLPFFAISPVFFDSLWSSYYKRTLHFDRFAHFFVAIQHRLFYIVLLLARFNLYANSYPFILKKTFDTKRVRGAAAGRGPSRSRGSFSSGTGLAASSPAPDRGGWASHTSLSATSLPRPCTSRSSFRTFPCRPPTSGQPSPSLIDNCAQLRTSSAQTRLGGFTAVCSCRSHITSSHASRGTTSRPRAFLVKEFAKEQGLVYEEFGWISGNQDVLGMLKGVADQVKIIGTVAQAEAKEAVDRKLGLHTEKKG
ncbi:Delta 8-sphingoloid desaturase protein [Mycena venus]|uniref:Delta 8-(E)-sphingolipid desaturase n=1 Tax=Mycena venus TaxID=2733690 RepID=A0A8H6XX11_9AGAR|nr:Delta 8-sphingoloid desaturase protein [Mycena venus]